jgi:hypothetical protein
MLLRASKASVILCLLAVSVPDWTSSIFRLLMWFTSLFAALGRPRSPHMAPRGHPKCPVLAIGHRKVKVDKGTSKPKVFRRQRVKDAHRRRSTTRCFHCNERSRYFHRRSLGLWKSFLWGFFTCCRFTTGSFRPSKNSRRIPLLDQSFSAGLSTKRGKCICVSYGGKKNCNWVRGLVGSHASEVFYEMSRFLFPPLLCLRSLLAHFVGYSATFLVSGFSSRAPTTLHPSTPSTPLAARYLSHPHAVTTPSTN